MKKNVGTVLGEGKWSRGVGRLNSCFYNDSLYVSYCLWFLQIVTKVQRVHQFKLIFTWILCSHAPKRCCVSCCNKALTAVVYSKQGPLVMGTAQKTILQNRAKRRIERECKWSNDNVLKSKFKKVDFKIREQFMGDTECSTCNKETASAI